MLDGSMNQKQIAAEIKVTEQTIINWKKNEDFQALQFKMERDKLKSFVPKAMKTLVSLLNAESDTVRFYASRDILDRAGHKAVDEIKMESESTVNVSNNSIQQLSVEELRMFIEKADDTNEDK